MILFINVYSSLTPCCPEEYLSFHNFLNKFTWEQIAMTGQFSPIFISQCQLNYDRYYLFFFFVFFFRKRSIPVLSEQTNILEYPAT